MFFFFSRLIEHLACHQRSLACDTSLGQDVCNIRSLAYFHMLSCPECTARVMALVNRIMHARGSVRY